MTIVIYSQTKTRLCSINPLILQILLSYHNKTEGDLSYMKATGIVRRIDDLGRVVIPKEIRRTMRIREGDPSLMSLTRYEKFCFGMLDLAKRQGWQYS